MPVPDSRAYWSMGDDGQWHAVNVSALAPAPEGNVYGPIPEPPRLAAMEAAAGLSPLRYDAGARRWFCVACGAHASRKEDVTQLPGCVWLRAQEPSDA